MFVKQNSKRRKVSISACLVDKVPKRKADNLSGTFRLASDNAAP